MRVFRRLVGNVLLGQRALCLCFPVEFKQDEKVHKGFGTDKSIELSGQAAAEVWP